MRKKLGGHGGSSIDGEPTIPNLVGKLGENDAKLVHQGAVNPVRVLRGRINLIANPLRCADLGINSRVGRNGGGGIYAGK